MKKKKKMGKKRRHEDDEKEEEEEVANGGKRKAECKIKKKKYEEKITLSNMNFNIYTHSNVQATLICLFCI